MEASDGAPAELIFDSFENLHVEALRTVPLAVIPSVISFKTSRSGKGNASLCAGASSVSLKVHGSLGPATEDLSQTDIDGLISLNYGIPAYYSSRTARLYELKVADLPNGEDLSQHRSNVIWTATFVGFLRMRSEYTSGVFLTALT